MPIFLRSLVIAAALLVLLPSCMRSSVGEHIRAGGELRLGVDVNHPVDALRYCIPATEERPEQVYVLAPELSYRAEQPLMLANPSPLANLLGLTAPYTPLPASDIRPTGRVLVVECRYWNHELRPEKILSALPPGTQACGMHPDQTQAPMDTHRLGCFGYSEEAGTGRRLAAAPFDYLIDPVVTVGATAANVVSAVGFFVFIWLPQLIVTGDAHSPL